MIQPVDIVQEALKLAEFNFSAKFDKAGKPMTQHIYRVWSALKKEDENTQAAALLHELFEDCPEWGPGQLAQWYPVEVVNAVVALTRVPGERYKKHIARVSANSIAVKVKREDLRDNMDLTRIPRIGFFDIIRLLKYRAAYRRLEKL
jgi:(p)ppGpp synthase/HD superfamily hydrolase